LAIHCGDMSPYGGGKLRRVSWIKCDGVSKRKWEGVRYSALGRARRNQARPNATQHNATQARAAQRKGDATYSRTKRGKTTGDRKLELARLAAKALYGLTQLVDPPSELVLELLEGGEERFGMCTVGSVVIGRL
jgi:hypothetical protein